MFKMRAFQEFIYKHKGILSGFGICLGVLWNAVWPVQILYGAVLLGVMLFTRGKLKPLLSLMVTGVAVLLFMPYILKGAHIISGQVMAKLMPLPELVYRGGAATGARPKISIVIPAYNYEQYVGRAVESAAMQKVDVPYEVVVVDDGSTDNTLVKVVETAKKYDNVRVYAHKKNRGLITNRNSGIALARGEWIFNLDADDYIAEDALMRLYGLVKEHQAELAYTWYQNIWGKKTVHEACGGRILKTENCITNFILYSKKDWQKYGGYSYLFSKGIEDWAFHLNFAGDNKKIMRTSQAVGYYLEKRQGRNHAAKKYYWPLWWIVQEYLSYQYGWNVRFSLFMAGFNKNLIKRVFHKLQAYENENFAEIPLYEVH